MAGYPPPFPRPGAPFGVDPKVLKYQRRMARDQAKAQRDQYRYQMQAMRRGSILGPVVMVTLGVVFLLVETGKISHQRLFDWYGQWWPLLLVLAGAVLLIEWGIDRAMPRDPQVPYVRRTAGGGAVTLIVLLAIGGAVFGQANHWRGMSAHGFSINPDNMAEFLGSKHESDQTLDDHLVGKGSLTVNNPHGDVTITGASTDGLIHIAVHKQVYSSSDTDADNKAKQLSPGMSTSGGNLTVSLPSLDGGSADLTMTVPWTAALTVNANHGDVRVDAMRAPVTVTANHGDVAVSAITGAVVAHVNNSGSSFSAHGVTGPVSIEGRADDLTLSDIGGATSMSGDFYGTTHLEHIRSAVKFHTSRTDFQLARLDGEMDIDSERISAEQAAGPVVLTTRNRNISLDRVSGELSVTNRNGTVDLTSAPPMGNVTVDNRSGNVSLTLPDKATFVVNAETADGDMENDFSLPSQEVNSHKTLNGMVGKGGSLIRINTSQGDVSLHKASIAPIPMIPPAPPASPAAPGFSIHDDDGSSVVIGKDGVKVISSGDGSSVIIGKDGVRVTKSADGSSVVVGKDGVRITRGSDGSSNYQGRDGTRLIENADGSKMYTGRDGTRYTANADGSKVYVGRDGARITLNSDGAKETRSVAGRSMTDEQIRDRLRRAEDDVREAERHRDEEQKRAASGHD